MAKAQVFALLSALMSLVYLACLPAVVILLFFNWMIALCLIFECRLFLFRRIILIRFKIDLKNMIVGVVKLIGRAMTEITICPSDAGTESFNLGNTPLQSRMT